MDFHTMKRRQLQALCKKHGIPANSTNVEMSNKLTLLLTEKAKPITRGRSCLKNLSEITSDNDAKDETRMVKKVTFSPENEMIEFVDLKDDSSKESPQPIKRRSRRRSVMKPVLKQSGLVIETNPNPKVSEGIMNNPIRVTTSWVQKSMDGDEDMVSSSHSSEKVPRRLKQNMKKANDSALLDGKSRQLEIGRRITRSRTQFVGQEASALLGGKGTGKANEIEVQEECEVVFQLEEPSRGFGRKASKRKSVAPRNEKVRSYRPLADNETGKQSRNTLLEGLSEIQASEEVIEENEKVFLANGPLRRFRCKTKAVKSTVTANQELGSHEIVGSIETSKRLEEPLPVKEASVSEVHLRRSRRNNSRLDSIATSNGIEGIVNAIGKNETWKRRRDPILEEETFITECQPLIEDPPRRFTRNASKRQSIAFAGLTGKNVEKKQPQNRSTVPILEVDTPLSNNKLPLVEPPVVDAEFTVAEAAKCSNNPVFSHRKQVAKDSKKRRRKSKKKSISKKQNSCMEVCRVVSNIEDIEDITTVNLEDTPAPKSVNSLSVTTNQETKISVRESVVATHRESISLGDEKQSLLQEDSYKADETCCSQIRREDFNNDNSVEPPVGNFSSVYQSNCASKLADLIDFGKGLEIEEEISIGTCVHPGGIVADHGAEDDKTSVLKVQNLEECVEADNSAEPVMQGFVLDDHVSECNESGDSKKNSESTSEEAGGLSVLVPSDKEGITTIVSQERGITEDESFAVAAVIQEAVSVSHAVTDEIVAGKDSEIQFTTSSCSVLGTPLTPIVGPEAASGSGGKVISFCGFTLAEQERNQADFQYLVQPTMLGRRNSNNVEGEESSSYKTEIHFGTICSSETVVSKTTDGIRSEERTEEVVTAEETVPEEASYMGRSKAAADRVATYAGTKVDVEFVRVDSEGQLSKDHEIGCSEKSCDNDSEEVMEKSVLEFSSGEGITLLIAERDTDRVDNPLTLLTAVESSGIVDKDMPSCENISLKGHDDHKQEEDQLKFELSMTSNTSIPMKKEETSCHEAEMVNGTMSKGEEALASNVVTGRFSQGKSEQVGGEKESGNKEISEIGNATPIISKAIIDEDSIGNLNMKSMGAAGSIYQGLDESFSEDGLVADDKQIGFSKANCESASEEGRRTHSLKFFVEGEAIPVISEEREQDKAKNVEEVSGIHEVVAEPHELPTDNTAVKDFKIEHARISQFSGVTAPITPIYTPECQVAGSHIGYKNISSCNHSPSIDNDMQGQEESQCKVPASNTNLLDREEALLPETENWVLYESSSEGTNVLEEKMKATSVEKHSECVLGKEPAYEEMEAGSLLQSAAIKELLDGKQGESANVKGFCDEVLSQHMFGDCGAERREKTKVTFGCNGVTDLPKEELIVLSSPELVSKKLYDHEEESVERNCSFDAVKDLPSGKNNVASGYKFNDGGMKVESKVGDCDHAVNEKNAELCPEFELGEHNDYQKVVAQVNGCADSILAETICKGSEASEETTVEMMKSTFECITITDMLKGEDNGGTPLPVCLVQLSQMVSDFDDEFAKMNVNAPGVSGKTVVSKASEETLNEVGKEKSIFPVKELNFECKDVDVLIDIKSETIPQVDELMSVDPEDHREVMLREMEQSYFITSDNLMPEDGEAAGRKEKVRTMEGKFESGDKNSCAMAVDVDALQQITENDSGNHLEKEKASEVDDSDWDDHIGEQMDMLNKIEKGGTLQPAGPVGHGQVVSDYGLGFSQMTVGVPGASDETICADGEDLEAILNEVSKTRSQSDETKFGSHYDHKEELDKSSSVASDAEHGEAAEELENVKTMESNMNFMGYNSDVEREEDVDASPPVTREDFGDQLVEEDIVNVNESDHDVILDHICDNARVAVNKDDVVSMYGKSVSENTMDGTPFSLQRVDSDSKLDVGNSVEVKLFAHTPILKPEMVSSDVTVSLLNVSLSHGNEYRSHVYNKDVSNDAGEEETSNDAGEETSKKATVMDMSFHIDNEVTMEKSIGAKKCNLNDASDGSCVEKNARTSQKFSREQLGDHVGAMEEAASVAGSDCLTSHGSSCKFDEMLISAGHYKEFADFENLLDVSSLKPEMGGNCFAVSPVSAPNNHEHGTVEFEVEPGMFSSREINLFSADSEEYNNAKESNVGLPETTITCEGNEDAREVNENEIVTQLVAEEQLDKDTHLMEEKVDELNGTCVAFSDVSIFEDGVASMEQNNVIITSVYNMRDSIEVENSCVSMHFELLTEVAKMDGSDHAISEETTVEGSPKESMEENVVKVAMTDGEKCEEADGEKCEEMGEAMELSEAILNTGLTMVDQSPAFIDSAIDKVVAAEDAKMQQSELEFSQKKNEDAKVDYSNSLSVKQLDFSTTRRKNIRTTLIPKTPKKLTLDMKENTSSIKRELTGSITVTKSVTKRRALEDLQKN